MKQFENTFDIFVREGFHNPDSNGKPDQIKHLYGSANVRTYPLNRTFKDILPEIRNGKAPFIMFIDNMVNIPQSNIRELTQLLLQDSTIPGLTFNSEALRTVYGIKDENAMGDNGLQPLYPIQWIPSWFCVLNRYLLKEEGLFSLECDTLEFFLLEISKRLMRNSKSVFRLESFNLNIVSRFWISDLILQSATILAADYDSFKRRSRTEGKDGECPVQFKVELSGEYISVPKSPQSKPRSHSCQNSLNLKISVVCPAYKHEFFKEMLYSVFNQTWRNWELIVIIDGPPAKDEKRLLSMLQQHASDPRIRYYKQRNMGTGPTRQRLFSLAKGDFIISIDDDDMFAPDTLEVFVGAIRQYPEIQIFRGGTQLTGLVDQYLCPRRRVIINGISNDIFEVNQPYVIARSLVELLGGFEGDNSIRGAGEDSDFFHKVDKTGLKTYIIDRPLYFRRISMYNQILSFRPEEALAHVYELNRRHCPDGWKIADLHFEGDQGFVKQITTYHNDENDNDVTCATRYFNYQTVGDNSHVLIDLEITSACNASCSFCPRVALNRRNKFISLDIVNILAEHIRNEDKKRQVVLCGIGEPTLHPELETIVRALSGAGAKVCMTTNGSHMNVGRFRQLAAAGMVEFNFSLNASTPETHQYVMHMKNYNTIKHNLLNILALRKESYPEIDINVSFVYCGQNRHEVVDFVNEWKSCDVSNIWIHPVNNRAGILSKGVVDADILPIQKMFADDKKVLVDIFKHKSAEGNVCKIARSLDFISVDGEKLLCAMDYAGDTSFGNVKYATPGQTYLAKISSYINKDTEEICTGCDFYPKE